MANLKTTWQDGEELHGSDINEITSTVNEIGSLITGTSGILYLGTGSGVSITVGNSSKNFSLSGSNITLTGYSTNIKGDNEILIGPSINSGIYLTGSANLHIITGGGNFYVGNTYTGFFSISGQYGNIYSSGSMFISGSDITISGSTVEINRYSSGNVYIGTSGSIQIGGGGGSITMFGNYIYLTGGSYVTLGLNGSNPSIIMSTGRIVIDSSLSGGSFNINGKNGYISCNQYSGSLTISGGSIYLSGDVYINGSKIS